MNKQSRSRNQRTLRTSFSIALLAAAAHKPARAEVLTPELVVDLARVTEAVLSPDGKQVAYVLSLPRAEDDAPGGPYSEIWLSDVADGGARQLTRSFASSSAPRFSPDGRWLAFLSQRDELDEHAQIFSLPLDGGEPVPLTTHPTGVQAFRWSPNGTALAFTAEDPLTEEARLAQDEGRDWTVVGARPRFVRLFLLDIESGETVPLYEGGFSTSSFAWSPDGEFVAFAAARTPGADPQMMHSRLYTVPRSGGEPRAVCKTAGKLGEIAVSPDGKQLAWLGAVSLNDPLPQSLFVTTLPEGEPKNLTERMEASGSSCAWRDGRSLLLLVTAGTQSRLMSVDSESGERAEVAPAPFQINSFDLHADSGTVAAVVDAPAFPSEVAVGALHAGQWRRLTESNPVLARVRLARQEVVEWQGPGELTIAGVVTCPLDFEEGQKYPLVVNPHGGPEGASTNGWNPFAQMLAARGFFVLQPNYRGSGGRGVAFSQGDHNDLGGKEFQDILAGVDELVRRGWVDSQRVGIGGWSYGGYLSAFAATHHSSRFKAAVMGAGISNWLSFAGTTDIVDEMSLVHWNQRWLDDPMMYWKRSPLSAIGQADTPVLILHGAADERVHPGQAWEMYHALRQKGVPVELVLYPRASHGISERAHRLDLYTRQIEWFHRYLK